MFWVQLILAANLTGGTPEIPAQPDSVAPTQLVVEKSATGAAARSLLRDELLAAFEDGFVIGDIAQVSGPSAKVTLYFEGPENLVFTISTDRGNRIKRVEVGVAPTPHEHTMFVGLSEDSRVDLNSTKEIRSLQVDDGDQIVLGTDAGAVHLAEIIGC